MDIEAMKDFGYANSWYGIKRYPNGWDKPPIKEPDNIPIEYTKCIEAGHVHRHTNVGYCLNRYTCDICQITYLVDSSD